MWLDGEDSGFKGVTRVVRLPGGRNTKPDRQLDDGTYPKCELIWFEPGRETSLDDLADSLGIDLDYWVQATPNVTHSGKKYHAKMQEYWQYHAFSRLGMIKGVHDHKIDVVCPWEDQHTGGAETASWFPQEQGFQCHHGHCIDKTGRDVDAWLEAQHGATEIAAMKQEAAKEEMPDLLLDADEQDIPVSVTQKQPYDMPTKRYKDHKQDAKYPDRFLDKQGICMRKALTIISGDPGVGKSMFTLNYLLAGASTPANTHYGDWYEAPRFLYISVDDPYEIVVGRIAAHNQRHKTADQNPHLYCKGDPGFARFSLNDTDCLKVLTAKIQHEKLNLVVIDPLAHVLGVDENVNSDVGRVLGHLADVAAVTDASIVVVDHHSKASDVAQDYHKLRGASAKFAACRVHWMAQKLPKPEDYDHGDEFFTLKNTKASHKKLATGELHLRVVSEDVSEAI